MPCAQALAILAVLGAIIAGPAAGQDAREISRDMRLIEENARLRQRLEQLEYERRNRDALDENAKLKQQVEQAERENAQRERAQRTDDNAELRRKIDSIEAENKKTAAKPAVQPMDKPTDTYNGQPVYTGPRGGRYYITPSGAKRYLPR